MSEHRHRYAVYTHTHPLDEDKGGSTGLVSTHKICKPANADVCGVLPSVLPKD